MFNGLSCTNIVFFNSDTSKEVVQEGAEGRNVSELEQPFLANARESKGAAPSPGRKLHNQPMPIQLVKMRFH